MPAKVILFSNLPLVVTTLIYKWVQYFTLTPFKICFSNQPHINRLILAKYKFFDLWDWKVSRKMLNVDKFKKNYFVFAAVFAKAPGKEIYSLWVLINFILCNLCKGTNIFHSTVTSL